MPLHLPAISRANLEPTAEAVRAALTKLLTERGDGAGWFQVRTGDVERFLFVLHGKIFCAGSFHQDRFGALPIASFFDGLGQSQSAEVCRADLPLFLSTAVIFRKAPAAHISSQLVDSAALLEHVHQTGKDAVLVIRRGDARSLVFCHGGEARALYPADGEPIPEKGSVSDRIVDYVYAEATRQEIVLDLYDEIKLPPSADAGKTPEEYSRSSAAGPTALLIVKLSDRVVFRYPILSDTVSVGRGGGNDLALDNLSISRSHARILRHGELLHVEDLGSENGLSVHGKKVTGADLRVGDEIALGKYTLLYRQLAPGEVVPAAPTQAPAVPAIDETIAIPSYNEIGEVEHDGARYRVSGLMFTIGKKQNASLRIKGFFIAPQHARISRRRDGGYTIEHTGGRSAVKVNGTAIDTASLRDGDEVTIGSESMRFHLVAID